MAYARVSEQAKKIKKELVDLNITQRELAQLIGISESYLSAMMRGRRTKSMYWKTIESALADVRKTCN